VQADVAKRQHADYPPPEVQHGQAMDLLTLHQRAPLRSRSGHRNKS